MAKAFIPVVVLAADFAIPTLAFAHGNAPLVQEPMRAQLVQLQQAGDDRTNGAPQYPSDIMVSLKSVAAQQQAFASYGGVNSPSAS